MVLRFWLIILAWTPMNWSPASASSSARGQRGHAIDHDQVHRVAGHQLADDVERIGATVRLAEVHRAGVHAAGSHVGQVYGVLHVDVDRCAAQLLGLSHDVLGQRRLTAALGAKDLGDPATRHAAHAQGAINGQGAGGDGRDVHWFVVQVHQDALAELFAQVIHYVLKCSFCHRSTPSGIGLGCTPKRYWAKGPGGSKVPPPGRGESQAAVPQTIWAMVSSG
jgi:hypothetical protein